MHPTQHLQVGQTVECAAGAWTGSPGLAYEFREATNGDVVQSGPAATYKLHDADAGRRLLCRVLATNAGGTTFDQSDPSSTTSCGAPVPHRAADAARRGATATFRVKLLDWARPFGKVDVCVTLSPRVGGKVLPRRDAGRLERRRCRCRLKVKLRRRVVRARASVTANAADGRKAGAPAFVLVR